MDATFGHALYYPYIHFQDENWLKSAALYYDGLSRIVPERFNPNDSHVVKILNDEIGFIKNIPPGWAAAAIVHDFLDFARRELTDSQRRKRIIQRIGRTLPSNSGFIVHVDKMAMALREELPKLGLAKFLGRQDIRNGGWYEFEPVTGALYMTYLANNIAESRGLPIVTDSPIYQPFIRVAQSDNSQRRIDAGHALASIVIKTAVPQQIEDISIKKVIQFRNKHNDERHQFYEGIRNLVKDFPRIDDSNSLQDCLNHHQKSIDNALKNLKLSFKSVGISCTTGLLGLSIPSWASKFASLNENFSIQIIAGGAVCVAISTIIKEGINYNKSRRESPWSYILSLKKLNSKSLIADLLGGTVLI